MEKGRTFETVVGVFVLVVAGLFFNYVYHKSSWQSVDGYVLTARFDHADGIHEGSEIKVSGLRAGKVISANIDKKDYSAVVKFYVSKDIKLPTDTTAKISNDGLLGGKYIELVPGEEKEILKENEEISNTVGPVNFESLVGKFLSSGNKKEED